jgi:hypothetical protein
MEVGSLLLLEKWTPRRIGKKPMPAAAQAVSAKLCDFYGHTFPEYNLHIGYILLDHYIQ